MKLILLLGNFSRTIMVVYVYFVVYALFLLYAWNRHEWGTSVLALWACVKVDNCCDPFCAGTLTHVNLLEYVY
jgi:hypothetical protein